MAYPAEMSAPDLSTLGLRVKWRRKLLGLTQVQLSGKAGLGQSAISSIENDDTRWLRGPNLLRLALALDVDAGWLETGTGAPQLSPYRGDDTFIRDLFSALTPSNKRRLVGLGQVLLAEQTGAAYAPGSEYHEATPTVLAERPSVADPFPHAPVPPLRHRRKVKKATP